MDRHEVGAAEPGPEQEQNDQEAIRKVLAGEAAPDAATFQDGRNAHAAGLEFHECPHAFHSYRALCWRIGWNDRALEQDLEQERQARRT